MNFTKEELDKESQKRYGKDYDDLCGSRKWTIENMLELKEKE